MALHPITQKLFDTLRQHAEEYGEKLVRDAISKFNRRKKTSFAPKRKTVPRSWTLAALKRQGGICHRCREELPERYAEGDHLKPLAGATREDSHTLHTKGNIRALCPRCNRSKGSNSLHEEAQILKRNVGETVAFGELLEEESN
jgi:5-methylcytosine-specific restriction endonuclease McrA